MLTARSTSIWGYSVPISFLGLQLHFATDRKKRHFCYKIIPHKVAFSILIRLAIPLSLLLLVVICNLHFFAFWILISAFLHSEFWYLHSEFWYLHSSAGCFCEGPRNVLLNCWLASPWFFFCRDPGGGSPGLRPRSSGIAGPRRDHQLQHQQLHRVPAAAWAADHQGPAEAGSEAQGRARRRGGTAAAARPAAAGRRELRGRHWDPIHGNVSQFRMFVQVSRSN